MPSPRTSTWPTSPSRCTAAASCRPSAGGDGTWLSQAVDQIAAAGLATSDIAADLRQVALRPVFTAHPTEAARRTVLTKIQQIAALLDEWDRARPATARPTALAERRVRRRLEELIDLLWQTDELRVARPDVIDEARNAIYYFDALHRDAVPQTLEALTDELARLGVELPLDARPAHASARGSAATATATRTSPPSHAARCSRCSTTTPSATRCALVDELRDELSSSVRIAGVTAELESSLAADLERLPRARARATGASTPRSPTGSS